MTGLLEHGDWGREYFFREEYPRMKLIWNTKCLTSDLWRLSQNWKRFKKQVKKTYWGNEFMLFLNYFK